MEETLSQEASPNSLDKFLPRIRDIIITLLHGLKRKQQRLRAKQSKDGTPTSGLPESSGSSASLNGGLNQMLENVPNKRKGSDRRTGSSGSGTSGRGGSGGFTNGEEQGVPPRYSSMQPTRQGSGSTAGEPNTWHPDRESKAYPTASSDSFNLNGFVDSTPILPQNSEKDLIPSQKASSSRISTSYAPPPPPPPPKQQDALAQLQRGGDLERRASRRYSAYQISKHLGASPNGVPMLPPAQNSPIPNRGRDVRESMHAVRTRGSGLLSQQRPGSRVGEPSPVRNNAIANRISEESNRSSDTPIFKAPLDPEAEGSPIAKTPEDKLRVAEDEYSPIPQASASLAGPLSDAVPRGYAIPDLEESVARNSTSGDQLQTPVSTAPNQQAENSSQQFIPEDSPQPGKELTLFLQYKSKIKKFVLPEGATDLSVARLQLAFIEKFAWNTHNHGNDLPEIYIQDPVSGVRHELEDLRDVKDRSVLVLNVEVLDEVKKHIDLGLDDLKRAMEGVRTVVDGQRSEIQRVSESQQDATREMARLASAPKTTPPHVTSVERSRTNGAVTTSGKTVPAQLSDIATLRRDLTQIRNTMSSYVTETNTSMATVQAKATTIKTIAIDGMIPNIDTNSGRGYVNAGKKLLGEDSEKIVNRVDDLQDIVEDLRKDVVTRGVRPLPRQLETVGKSISSATAQLKKMQEYLKREKPIWTKIWEKELELVCTDRDLLTMQEELAADLEDDLEKATQTFALVEQATKQQNLQSNQSGVPNLRNTSRGLNAIAVDQDVDPMKAKDGVLGEVRALRPNHETRLEAIARAEKARQQELESRREGEFTKELGSFVQESKLKKSVGVEEAERIRKSKDEKNRREAWQKQQEQSARKGKEREAPPEEQVDEPTASSTVDGDADPDEPSQTATPETTTSDPVKTPEEGTNSLALT